jgi:hypothetical protein
MTGYCELMTDKLTRYFDIEKNFKVGRINFDFIARYNQRSAKYFLMKNMEIYSFENNELILYKNYDEVTKDDIDSLVDLFSDFTDKIVDRKEDHMSSVVTFLIETKNPLDKKTLRKIKRTKLYKSYMFGLKGWVNGKIIIVDPSQNTGVANKLGKKNLENFLVS